MFLFFQKKPEIQIFIKENVTTTIIYIYRERESQVALVVKNPPASAGTEEPGFDPWVWKILWRREWLPTPGSLPGESHGQRSLVAYSPWGRKESDTTEAT